MRINKGPGLFYLLLYIRWSICRSARTRDALERIITRDGTSHAALQATVVKLGRAAVLFLAVEKLVCLIVSMWEWGVQSNAARGWQVLTLGVDFTLLAVALCFLLLAQPAFVLFSYVDPLTNVLNRRGFDKEIYKLSQASRSAECWVSVLFIDIDHFKLVNDNFGHVAGDHILRHTARQLRRHVREQDVIMRYGGDEFVIVLKNSSPERCKTIADRVGALTVHLPKGPQSGCATLSVGAVSAWCENFPVNRVIAAADALLHEAKTEGRNRVIFKVITETVRHDATATSLSELLPSQA